MAPSPNSAPPAPPQTLQSLFCAPRPADPPGRPPLFERPPETPEKLRLEAAMPFLGSGEGGRPEMGGGHREGTPKWGGGHRDGTPERDPKMGGDDTGNGTPGMGGGRHRDGIPKREWDPKIGTPPKTGGDPRRE